LAPIDLRLAPTLVRYSHRRS